MQKSVSLLWAKERDFINISSRLYDMALTHRSFLFQSLLSDISPSLTFKFGDSYVRKFMLTNYNSCQLSIELLA